MINKLKILFLLSMVFLVACEDMFDYSPYVINFNDKDTGVNLSSIEKLSQIDEDSIIRIAFTGDTHRFFDQFENFISSVNNLNNNNPIDFVIHVGDIADFGLPQQYIWGNSYLLNLNCPYFVTIGNHDLVGNGSLAYTEMFGAYDFSFIYSEIKFVFINTNSREFSYNGEVPDINWLDSQLTPNDNFKNAIVIFHIPPMEGDFDSTLEEDFHTSIAKYDNVLFTVHGHLHHHEIYTPYSDSISYINVFGVEYNKFNVIEITGDSFKTLTYEF